ncbi:MAG TPA: A/G-specific adenine glycosylase [Vulgatibacter sp.]|nr:A/G-specific adenine glycosylase [Vulgatibacter sp.]
MSRIHPFTAAEVRRLHRDLLRWYGEVARDLPWRRTRDPYGIWVSEVMLQQTRVETVKRYWGPFLERFPTVEALAAAPLDEVLARWSGLGYYARARALHRAAAEVVERFGGALPGDPTELSTLPGFGPYTTAAVGSIALGLDLAAVDGNVARVFSRWTLREGDPREPKALAHLRELGAALLPPGRAGDWNQALMELGASLCGPGSPACGGCPVAASCRARRAGRQDEVPPRRRAKARPSLRLAAALVRRGDEVLFAKRPGEGLFASLWELPAVQVEGSEDARERLRAWLGVPPVRAAPRAIVSQTLTHRELELAVYEVDAGALERATWWVAEPYVDARWCSLEDDPPGGLSSVTRKALRAVGRGGGGGWDMMRGHAKGVRRDARDPSGGPAAAVRGHRR